MLLRTSTSMRMAQSLPAQATQVHTSGRFGGARGGRGRRRGARRLKRWPADNACAAPMSPSPVFALASASIRCGTPDTTPARSRSRRAPRFRDFVASTWKDAHFPRYKHSTRAGVNAALRSRLLPAFGATPLDRVTRHHVLRWFDAYSQTASGGANHALRILRQILDFAIAQEQLSVNPAHDVTMNRRIAITPFLSRHEVRRLHRALDRHARTGTRHARQADIIRLSQGRDSRPALERGRRRPLCPSGRQDRPEEGESQHPRAPHYRALAQRRKPLRVSLRAPSPVPAGSSGFELSTPRGSLRDHHCAELAPRFPQHLPHALARDSKMLRRRALAHPLPGRQARLAIPLHDMKISVLLVSGKGHTGRALLRCSGTIPPPPWSTFLPPYFKEPHRVGMCNPGTGPEGVGGGNRGD